MPPKIAAFLTPRVRALYTRTKKPHILLSQHQWYAVGLQECSEEHKFRAGSFVTKLNRQREIT